MRYLESSSHDPAFNLALEQVVFDRLPRSESYFMLWQNHNAVIVGRHQNTAQEVNASFVRDNGIQVVRRLSGGGAVYHDLGNLNFTFVTDLGRSPTLDMSFFCVPVARALGKLGVKAEVTGRNDIAVDGKKFSGNAQYTREGRVMHHGTILFDSDLSVISRALTVRTDKLASHGVASVSSRVTNLKPYLPVGCTLEQFKEAFVRALFDELCPQPCDWTDDDLRAAEELRQERYATWEWNYGASPAGTLRREKRFDGCGTIAISLATDKGRITGAVFQGDWFGAEEPDGLLPILIGLPLERAVLERALSTIEVDRYFKGLTAEQLAGLLAE